MSTINTLTFFVSSIQSHSVNLMDPLAALRMVAAVCTIVGAIMVALNHSPRITMLGFGVFVWASAAWLIDGWWEEKLSLIVQNAVLLLVNAAGVYRWLPPRE